MILRMLGMLIEEFKCNHQADVGQEDKQRSTKQRLMGMQQEIFTRDNEHKIITKFLTDNLRKNKSGLMYLCGHPGTGKTSSLNQILSRLRRAGDKGKIGEFQLFMFNAMTFTDVRSFALSLL